MIVFIHGGPQGAWMDAWSTRWNPAIYAAAGYVVFAPNPHGSTGFGHPFCEQISKDWGGTVFEDIKKGVDAVVAQGYVDANRIGAAGGSYGGYMVNWILGHDHRFKALVSHAGVYDLESMYGATEELWFPEWEFARTALGEPRALREVVAAPLRDRVQDADARHPRRARLPRARDAGLRALHGAAAPRRAVEVPLLPRRGPLGAEAAQFALWNETVMAGSISTSRSRAIVRGSSFRFRLLLSAATSEPATLPSATGSEWSAGFSRHKPAARRAATSSRFRGLRAGRGHRSRRRCRLKPAVPGTAIARDGGAG